MTPEQHQALIELSVYFHEEPERVLRRVLSSVVSVYPQTMAMVNITQPAGEGEAEGSIGYRDILNPHPLFARYRRIPLSRSYCQFTTARAEPVLIQDAAADPELARHPAVRLGLTRYLAVPIFCGSAKPVGTLCFLDTRSSELLGSDDIEFLSLLAMRVSTELEREQLIERRIAAERQAAEVRRSLVLTVAHDLRQPLTSMRVLLELLRTAPDSAEQEECLADLEDRLQALNALAGELMDYAHLHTETLPTRFERVDLGELLQTCLQEVAAEARVRQIRLELETAPELARCTVDRRILTHVVRNLLSNAVKHSKPRLPADADANGLAGRVRLSARLAGPEEWVLEVHDEGVGADPEVLRRMLGGIGDSFSPAEPADLPHAAHPDLESGYGLGLVIVRLLCDAMGGRPAVESRPGAGTLFRLTLPIRDAITFTPPASP